MSLDLRAILERAVETADAEERLAWLERFRSHPCGDPRLLNRAGVMYYKLGRLDPARACFNGAVSLDAGLLAALINLGACHNELGAQEDAVHCYRRALEADGTNPDIWSNLGKAYNDSAEFEMAVFPLRRAAVLVEESGRIRKLERILLGLARAYHLGGRDNRARDILERVVEIAPDNPHAHHSLASVCFHLGDYPAALREFEWRLQLPAMDRQRNKLPGIFDRPACADGRPGDRTLLLYTEQGYGDSLQFARFVPLLRPHVKRLVMWCRPGLGKLFRHALDIDEISEDRQRLPDFDLHFPLLSIPHFFDPTLKSLGAFHPYLFAPGEYDFGFQSTSTLNIGLVWGADKAGYDYANKTVPLGQLGPLLQMPGTCWYSLQVGEEQADIERLGLSRWLRSPRHRLADFVRTADAISQLDLVVTTDTAVAQLAGAMGKPVWVMLKKNPDWRWDSGRETSAWYPSARLFRQHSYGDWHLVIQRLAEGIEQLIHLRAET